MEIVVYGEAQPAGSKKGFVHPSTGRVVIVDDAKRSRPWKALVTDAAIEAMNGATIMEGPLRVSISFVVPRPKTHRTGTGNLSAQGRRTPFPTVRPDLLKLARAVEDALTGVVYRDDSQIVLERLQKVYGEPQHTRIVVAEMPAE